jgi:hypothetical protein
LSAARARGSFASSLTSWVGVSPSHGAAETTSSSCAARTVERLGQQRREVAVVGAHEQPLVAHAPAPEGGRPGGRRPADRERQIHAHPLERDLQVLRA